MWERESYDQYLAMSLNKNKFQKLFKPGSPVYSKQLENDFLDLKSLLCKVAFIKFS